MRYGRIKSISSCLPGKPYDWGKAQGQLLGEKAVKMMDAVWEYLEDQVVRYRGYLSLISIAAFDISDFNFSNLSSILNHER